MPHMITVDHSGNVWTTDVGKQVATKWSPTGEKLLELGTPLEPGNDKTHFCKPTQVLLSALIVRSQVKQLDAVSLHCLSL